MGVEQNDLEVPIWIQEAAGENGGIARKENSALSGVGLIRLPIVIVSLLNRGDGGLIPFGKKKAEKLKEKPTKPVA